MARFNADSFAGFVAQVLRYYDGTTIHLITDNVSHYRSPKVREWLKGKEDLIEPRFLPPHARKLTTLEYLGKKTKLRMTHSRYVPRFEDRDSLDNRIQQVPGKPGSLRTIVPHLA